ncbi:hypothetical protein, partial [Streptomyces spongiae]|uniref:hypothetical protein n=1 Tax=Streptomyces spongiae TaxID=565072 RepID=UPI001D13692B
MGGLIAPGSPVQRLSRIAQGVSRLAHRAASLAGTGSSDTAAPEAVAPTEAAAPTSPEAEVGAVA